MLSFRLDFYLPPPIRRRLPRVCRTCCFLRYALRLLHVAMISLRRAHHDHSALGVADAASAAVDRSLRIVHQSISEHGDRADLLKRKEVRGQLGSVQEMVLWAWEKVSNAG